jgi:hypothetical protein
VDAVAVVALGPDGKHRIARPDTEGRASFTISQAGPWLFKATRLTERANEWESVFTTLTAEAGK